MMIELMRELRYHQRVALSADITDDGGAAKAALAAAQSMYKIVVKFVRGPARTLKYWRDFCGLHEGGKSNEPNKSADPVVKLSHRPGTRYVARRVLPGFPKTRFNSY